MSNRICRGLTAPVFFLVSLLAGRSLQAQGSGDTAELFRPRFHFTPKANWINDPNGMVYHQGVYHLFFQYHPFSTVWGPMHWGHATSKDLVHWSERPIALYPDSLGTIFSGSAVVDINNSSGFGRKGHPALVAIFTHHNDKRENSSDDFQNQSIAFSTDDGATWTKYAGNPVLKNPGIRDFRDPKVSWYEPGKKWIMTLAAKDRISFYSSRNLKDWKKESEFGDKIGSHAGVWECPDLFVLDDNGKPTWVLVVSVGSGGPNKGSAIQYFLGNFDGSRFTASDTSTRWIDYGPDDYAGITWSNTGKRKIFLGWMSNWIYADKVPTTAWRGAMTIARDLALKHVGKSVYLSSEPVREMSVLHSGTVTINDLKLGAGTLANSRLPKLDLPAQINLEMDHSLDFSIGLSNNAGQELVIGYEKDSNRYYLDRGRSGQVSFQEDFATRSYAPRLAVGSRMQLSLIIDVSSIELFADGGLTVMSQLYFPAKPYDRISIRSPQDLTIRKLRYTRFKNW
jgi:fructan beta-fructosidase